MSKPIVVGINGSAGSEAALAWALVRASRQRLPVIAVHAVDDRWLAPDFKFRKTVKESGMDLLQSAQARAKELAPNVTVDIQLHHGSAGSALQDASKEASMVVVGVHDKHWLDGGPMTDRALQIVSASNCPVAVIPPRPQEGHTGVVVGVDGSEESLQAVMAAAAEADREGDELTVVHAFPSTDRWVADTMPDGRLTETVIAEDRIVLSESVAGLRAKYPDLVVHQELETYKEPAKALVDAAAHARLLVIGSRGRGGFSRLVLGSTAHAVLLNVASPTIVTRLEKVKHND